MNSGRFPAGPIHAARNQTAVGALNSLISTGNAVVGNGNSSTRGTGNPLVEQTKGSGSTDVGIPTQTQAGLRAGIGAMSQQGSPGQAGSASTPQQFLRLVGCRDPKVRAGSSTRPAPKRR